MFTLTDLIERVGGWVSLALPVVAGLALLAFFWGLAKYIFSSADETKKAEGKNVMIYGIIALFVMVAVWGIVAFISSSLGISTGGAIQIQPIGGSSSGSGFNSGITNI